MSSCFTYLSNFIGVLYFLQQSLTASVMFNGQYLAIFSVCNLANERLFITALIVLELEMGLI